MQERFGPYELIERIAVGGMAEIFRAKRTGVRGFEKIYAVKRLHPRYSQDDDFIEMLVDEARITVQLTHPNIGQTIDLGQIDGHYYILMEFIDGRDLYRVLRRLRESQQAMPIEAAAFLAMEACQGLQYAHDKKDGDGKPLKIVHRDISPQNVLVSFEGEVKLIDFGIAKAELRAYETEAGIIKGNFYYMSPEQARGEILDHRTDIFSLGIVLYEMVTGSLLYKDDDEITLLSQVRRADIDPPSLIRPDIPSRFEQIIMRALAKDRSERYAHAGQMRRELERFLRSYDASFDRVKLGRIMRDLWRDEIGNDHGREHDDSLAIFDAANTTGLSDSIASFDEASDPTVLEGESAPQEESVFEINSGIVELAHDSIPTAESLDMIEEPSVVNGLQTANSVDPSEDFFENEPTRAFDRDDELDEPDEPSVIYKEEQPAQQPVPARPRVIGTKQRKMPDARADDPDEVDFSAQATSMLSEEELASPHPAWSPPVDENKSGSGVPPRALLDKAKDFFKARKDWVVFGAVLFGIALLTMVITQLVVSDNKQGAPQPERTAVPIGNGTRPINRVPARPAQRSKAVNAVVRTQATLELRTKPSRAQIYIDNIKQGNEMTPASIAIKPGRTVRVRLEMQSYHPHLVDVTLGQGETRILDVELDPILATIRVESNPSNATVFINGKEWGQTNTTISNLSTDGVYQITVKKDGFVPYQETVKWSRDSRRFNQTIKADLKEIQIEPLVREENLRKKRAKNRRERTRRKSRSRRSHSSAKPKGRGSLSVMARPWASIWVDGRFVREETPLIRYRLGAGRHRVKACFLGNRRSCQTKSVTIRDGEVTTTKFIGRSR
ncbi:MAG: serine/threonine-protein kinase [Myxococcota bacterium]|nr:serine/threonine-protein kinase [Myxococcota bacterium]